MRNFWLDTRIDGRKHPLRGGPVAKGSMSGQFKVKRHGESVVAFEFVARPTEDGLLRIAIYDGSGGLINAMTFNPK